VGRVDAAPRVLSEPAPRGERIDYGPQPEQFWERFGSASGVPGVVWIHGGFWKQEYDLEHAGHACAALAAEGIPVLNLEYRRDRWRHALEDVAAGTADARVVVGHSAGGHLALWTGLPAVALAPVADLEEARRLRIGGDAVERFFGRETPPEALPKRGARQILIHGTADETVPISLSERHGGRLIRLEGAGHFEPISPWSAEWPTVVKAIRELL
jgi:pimeloyl-ACP methyl ester carboxylesterase